MRLLPQRPHFDPGDRKPPKRLARNRLALMGCVLLVLSGVVGGAAGGHLAPDLGQMVFVVAVALFVVAMLTLAFGMIGDARRRR